MRKSFKKFSKDERGMFTIFSIFIILGVLVFAGLFINLTMTYMTINFSKKALEESVRTRAVFTDIPLKETTGIVEVINAPYSGTYIKTIPGTSQTFVRPEYDSLDTPIPGVKTQKYLESVSYAEGIAKESMVRSVNSFIGNNAGGEPIVTVDYTNICYDVKPLPETAGNVVFACPLKSKSGKLYTAKASIPVAGYTDKVNTFKDESGEVNQNAEVAVSNVVFGAAIIEPKSLLTTAFYKLGMKDENPIIIYSVAYPQIDSCYGDFCK